MPNEQRYIDILLPLPLYAFFTYTIPPSLNKKAAAGKRVIVQFGKNKIYTGIAVTVHDNKPAYPTKEIIDIIDETTFIAPKNFSFWQWLSDYYMCSLGDVFKASVPLSLRVDSQTKFYRNTDFSNYASLNTQERIVYETLMNNKKGITFNEINRTLKNKSLPTIHSLIKKNTVFTEEKLKKGYHKKQESFVSLAPRYKNENELHCLLNNLNRAEKQKKILLNFLHFTSNTEKLSEIPKKQLLNSSDNAAFTAMCKKNIFIVTQKDCAVTEDKKEINDNIILSPAQQDAYKKICSLFKEKSVVLLYGITSSGKTEIYTKLIKNYISQGKQVLYLLPEIALTTQIIDKLKYTFGSLVAVYHSKYGDTQRADVWMNVQQNKQYKIIIGVRSALLLPFSNLGLVIVDEEHENTYKQNDSNPRYHARDAAIYCAKIHSAHVLLGSATPSVESYYNATSGKYGFVSLTERYNNTETPEIQIVDMKKAGYKKELKSHFSSVLLEQIASVLERKEQVILFQNRRGFSLFLQCEQCGWVPYCKSCDVSLTYHKKENILLCHYCGKRYNLMSQCPQCQSTAIKIKEFGTEKIEEEIQIFFPDARVVRLDTDTAKTRNNYEKIINGFASGNYDILVGTQMISKGLNFNNVSLVAVLSADSLINYPDFRSYERAFQLMLQVSGRAGRAEKKGRVIIQSFNPFHNVLNYLYKNDYADFIKEQTEERKLFGYPPFNRLIVLSLLHRNKDLLDEAAQYFYTLLYPFFTQNIFGPEYPIIEKIKNLYCKNIMLKTPRNTSFKDIRVTLTKKLTTFKSTKKYKNVIIQTDVDPY